MRNKLQFERALGIQWCVKSDTFGLKIYAKPSPWYEEVSCLRQALFSNPWGFWHISLKLRNRFSRISLASSWMGMTNFPKSTVRSKKIGWQICQNCRLSVLIIVWGQQPLVKLHPINFIIFPMPQKLVMALHVFCNRWMKEARFIVCSCLTTHVLHMR